MFENVEDAGLAFKRTRAKRNETTIIILHNVGGEMSVQAIHDMHNNDTERGYNGIAYNVYVDLDGRAYWGRGLEYAGGATLTALGLNPIAFQIVANGDFNNRAMSEAQKSTIIRLVRDAVQYFGTTNIKGHREVGDTDCPGRNFPLDEIRAAVLGGAPTPAPQPTPEPTPPPEAGTPELTRNLKLTSPTMRGDDVRMAQERLNHHRANAGKVDGVFGKNTKAATIRFQQARIAEGDDIGAADGIIGPRTWRILWQG